MTDQASRGLTLEQLEGRPVMGRDGEKIGTVADVYFDKETRLRRGRGDHTPLALKPRAQGRSPAPLARSIRRTERGGPG